LSAQKPIIKDWQYTIFFLIWLLHNCSPVSFPFDRGAPEIGTQILAGSEIRLIVPEYPESGTMDDIFVEGKP